MQTERILARTVAAKREAAEVYLWHEMNMRGLFADDGWSIVETTRETATGTELVLRPLHRFLPSPEGLECVVEIHEDTHLIDAHCSPAAEATGPSAPAAA